MLQGLSEKLLGRLSRVTSAGRQFLPQIDGLRFIAIMLVVAFHVNVYTLVKGGVEHNLLASVLGIGDCGVQLFFVISGFILAVPFARQHLLDGNPLSLKSYFTRRLTRLEPPYIVHIIILFLVCITFRQYIMATPLPASQHESGTIFRQIAASLIYSYQFIYQAPPAINTVLWSLEIEVQFYILAPLLATVFSIRNVAVRRTVLAAGIVTCAGVRWLGSDIFMVTNTLAGNLQFFLTGFMLLDLYLVDWKETASMGYGWDLLSMTGWGLILFTHSVGGIGILLLPWAILIGYLAAFRGIVFRKFLCNVWIVTIGGMCYTIYMYHYWIVSAVGRFTIRLRTYNAWADIAIQVLIQSAVIVFISALLFVLFERPFMARDWHKKFWEKVTALRGSAVAGEKDGVE